MSRAFLGEFEQLVLLAILRAEPEAHGAALRRELRDRAGRSASLGAIYATVRRLTEKDFVTTQDVPSPKGGRPRRLARVTPAGIEALRRTRQAMAGMEAGLEDRLGTAGA
jgi:DNA-binding PadR family transcriptional regulator